MRRWIVLYAVIVSQVSLHGEESKVAAKRLMIRLPTVNALGARCGPGNSHVYACTQFVAPSLSAVCSSENEVWMIRTQAKFVALVYIVDRAFIEHEFLHIGDIEKSLNRHLEGVENGRFSNAESCAIAAGAEAAKFSETMKASADESNAQRH